MLWSTSHLPATRTFLLTERCTYATHSIMHFALCTWQHVRAAPSANPTPGNQHKSKVHNHSMLPTRRHSAAGTLQTLSAQPWVLLTNASHSSGWACVKVHHEVQIPLQRTQTARALQSLTTHSAGKEGLRVSHHCPLYAPHKGRTAGQSMSASNAI